MHFDTESGYPRYMDTDDARSAGAARIEAVTRAWETALANHDAQALVAGYATLVTPHTVTRWTSSK